MQPRLCFQPILMKKYSYAVALLLMLAGVSFAQQGKKWTLQECVDYALQNNISIKQSELDLQLAKIDKSDALGNFLPTLNADADHSWTIGLNQNITTGLLENQTTQYTSAGLNAGIDIYKGLENVNRMRRARLSALAAQYQLDKMKDDVSLNVADAFLQIFSNKENLRVLREQLSSNQRQMQRTEELVNSGSAPRGDLLDMKATVATSQKDVVDAENVLLISKLSLAQLLQLDDFKDFDVADGDYELAESPVMLQTPEAIFEKAKEARNELKIAKANLDIAEKDVKIASGAYQPTLQGYYSFSTSASYSDQIIGTVPDTDNPTSVIGTVEGTGQNVIQQNYVSVLGKYDPVFDQFSTNKGHSFGLQLSIPILNGFATRNGVERAKVTFERSKIAYSQAELDLERDVYQAFVDAKGALNAYETSLVAVEARELAFNYAQERYNVGMMNAFDLNQAQILLVNAQSDAVRAKFDYIFKVKVVEFYFGIPINKT